MSYKLCVWGLKDLGDSAKSIFWGEFHSFTRIKKIRCLRSVSQNGHRAGTQPKYKKLVRVEWFANCVRLTSKDGEKWHLCWVDFGTISHDELRAILHPSARIN